MSTSRRPMERRPSANCGLPSRRTLTPTLRCHGPQMRATEVTPTPMSKSYFVYILASKRNGTLYIGVTNDLSRRVWEHREGMVPGFTKKYGVKTLVYYEMFDNIDAAIHRETRLKKYKREWKLN